MRWDSSDRALVSLAGLFTLVYGAILVAAGGLVLRLDPGRVLPSSHIAADATIVVLAALVLAVLGIALGLPHEREARGLATQAARRAVAWPPEVRRSAAELSLTDRVVLTDDDAPAAFTVGMLRPRVIVSRGLLRLTSGRELAAILAHEAYHVRRHDPTRRLVVTVLCRALYRLPVAVQLRDRFMAATEFEADRRAIERSGRRPVAAALYRLLSDGEQIEPSLVAPMAGPKLLAARVAQLETGLTPVVQIATRPWLHTLLGLSLLVIAADMVFHALGRGAQEPLWDPVHGIAHTIPLWGLWAIDRLLHRAH